MQKLHHTTISVPTVATALPRTNFIGGANIQADPANTLPVRFGQTGVSTTTGFALFPGDSATFKLGDLSSVFIIGPVGQKITYGGEGEG